MADRTGPSNPNWKGGRVIDPRGYVLIRVGVGHPLADVRGYAYEHRLVAADKAGRALRRGEEVHHGDEAKGNNSLSNLELCKNRKHHARLHRKRDKGLREPGERNPIVNCACGCGSKFRRFDEQGRRRRFISGHNMRLRNG